MTARKRSRWNELLGLPDELRYPDLYQILGLDRRSFDPDRVDDVFREQMAKLQTVRSTKHKDFIEFAKGELRRARRILESETERADYDAELAEERDAELRRMLRPVLAGGKIVEAAEQSLVNAGKELGMTEAEARTVIDAEVARSGVSRSERPSLSFADTTGLTPGAQAALAASEAAKMARLAAEAAQRAIEAARLVDPGAVDAPVAFWAPAVPLGAVSSLEEGKGPANDAAIRRIVSERLGIPRRQKSDATLQALVPPPPPDAAPPEVRPTEVAEPAPAPSPSPSPSQGKPRTKSGKKKTAAQRAAAQEARAKRRKTTTVAVESIEEHEAEPASEVTRGEVDEETPLAEGSAIGRVKGPTPKKPVAGLDFCDACGVSIPARWKRTGEGERVGSRLMCASCATSARQFKVCATCEAILPKVAFERGEAITHEGMHYCHECHENLEA